MFPKTATSQQARDKLNKKTDDLPGLKETGQELAGGGDPIGAKNPQDVGRAVDKATPDVDLTKNPKSLGKDAVKGAKNALPDVSAVPTREEIIKKVLLILPRACLQSLLDRKGMLACTVPCIAACLACCSRVTAWSQSLFAIMRCLADTCISCSHDAMLVC